MAPLAPPRSSRSRRLVASALGSAALAALLPLAAAAPARAAAAPLCASTSHPALAAKIASDVKAALAGRSSTVGLYAWDINTGVFCSVNAFRHFDSASVVKATIMGAVLRRAQDQHRKLTSWEVSNLKLMITHSDNTAATNLWNSIGRTRFAAYLKLAGMTSTVPGSGPYWGLTQINAHDEVKLLNTFTNNHAVLSAASRAYALTLMSQVIPSQRWGVPYRAPSGSLVSNKNGWLPRATRAWRVHSIGAVTGGGRDYLMAVLSDNDKTMQYGIDTLQRITGVLNRDLGAPATAPATATATVRAATGVLPQLSDGSAPFANVPGQP
ncbi:serine hydrolase [Streptacidiphilus cavernicola]|uniref:Beta-lactamase n=1 Tax=Streptacidiphilus cavernicola TaxID=3342716 RepID=A0ABV6W125_9ACTN